MFVCLYRNIRQTGHGCGAIKLLLDSEASLGVVDIIGEVEPGLDVPMARDIHCYVCLPRLWHKWFTQARDGTNDKVCVCVQRMCCKP